MSKTEQYINDFHSNDICFGTKTIKVFGEIDESMMDRTISNLHILDQVSGDVTILLSSGGGDVKVGLAIYDAIRAMKNKVRIIAYEGVGSMASIIFQAADEGCRFMMPNSYLMLHEGESGVIGSKKDKEQYNRLLDWMEDTCNNIYLAKIKEKKPRFSKNKLLEFLDRDRIFLPQEAIDFGLADEILETY